MAAFDPFLPLAECLLSTQLHAIDEADRKLRRDRDATMKAKLPG